MSDEQRARVTVVSQAQINRIYQDARDRMINKDAPTAIDHRKHDNPYFSRYGANWEDNIAKSSQLRSKVKVTDMVSWYMKETERAFKGTSHETDWVIYHDALSLMTAASCKKWMDEHGYLKRWILPSADLFDGHPDLQKYAGNPIGNTPEANPWDLRLNQDVHTAHDDHVVITKKLAENHPLKFSGSTAKRMSYSYRRLVDPSLGGVSPTPARILQDINRIPLSFERIYEANGALIKDSNNRGRRYIVKDNEKQKKRGGKRKKQTKTAESLLLNPQLVLHRHAEQYKRDRLEQKRDAVEANQNNINEGSHTPDSNEDPSSDGSIDSFNASDESSMVSGDGTEV